MMVYSDGVRLRIPELLKEHGMTPYSLSKRSEGRISLSTAYRLARLNGRVKTFDAGMLEVMCEMFRCRSLDELLEREAGGKKRAK
ncbi:MAG: helix-turn-helix domain-containing protein [Gemmatimonadaceae bacterium]